WGTGMLGLPSSSLLTLALVVGGWWLLARTPVRAPAAPAGPPRAAPRAPLP
ncbi:MAG: hypothetical protein H5T83_06935, partial [Actinotalea sp.]|nr:hypothetical protein [Actinotalea sp.]